MIFVFAQDLIGSYYCDYFYFPRNIKASLWWEGVDSDVMLFLCVNKAFRFSSGVKCAFYSSLGQLETAISPVRPIGFKVTKELVVSASCFSSQTTAAKSSVMEVTLFTAPRILLLQALAAGSHPVQARSRLLPSLPLCHFRCACPRCSGPSLAVTSCERQPPVPSNHGSATPVPVTMGSPLVPAPAILSVRAALP